MTTWSTAADIHAAVQREWDSGRLLAARVPGAESGTAFPLAVRLRGPTSRELGDRFEDAKRWAAALDAASGTYRLERTSTTHRVLGAQHLPTRAWLDSPADAVRLVGRTRDARRFDRIVDATPPAYLHVVAAKPLAVLQVAEEWLQIVAVAEWLQSHPRPGVFLRQVDLPGVHSKVIERHKRLIASLVGPGEHMSGPSWFERSYGFGVKPSLLRFRSLDPATAPLPGLTDVTLPLAEFADLRPRVTDVFVTENEINFLTFPDATASLVIFGSGNGAPELLGGIDWLSDVAVHYWGDIDTHGFAILDRFRARLPHTASLLMDERTLLAHRDSWVVEDKQQRRDLPSLTDAEAQLYAALCEGRWGDRVRLEQEFVRFGAVESALGEALRHELPACPKG